MGRPRILIVDDEPNIRDTMHFALEAAGYMTVTASNGDEALQMYAEGQPWDLVVLDERLPGMDGLEVLKRLRQIRPDGCVLMVTAYATVELAVDAMKLGAADCLRKPFRPDVLRVAVQQILGRAAARPTEAPPVGPNPPPRPQQPAIPPFSYVTLNGYQFWPLALPSGGEETSALRIRRAFDVLSPTGDRQRCAVDITTAVREMVQDEARQELPPTAQVWDTVCKSALSDYLWQRATMPPAILVVFELTERQLQAVRTVLGLGLPKRT